MARSRPAAPPLPPPEALRTVRRALVAWYRKGHRDLPWRRTRDPYAIWVSEMMLQQTRVETVLPYYERWLRRFPTVRELAAAEEHEVLHAWAGLGYYSRARNLRAGAQRVVAEHGGEVPLEPEQLRQLPGIGPYAAGAIASIAGDRRAAVVDGNVVRVLCRAFGLSGDPARAPLKQHLWELAEALLPERGAGELNQALMELGAVVCVPRAPACASCPLAHSCAARRTGRQAQLPELAKRPKPVAVRMVAAVARRRGRVLVARLGPAAPRWAGMWQFPVVELRAVESAERAIARISRDIIELELDLRGRIHTVKHAVTRYRITLDAYGCAARAGTARPGGDYDAVRWVKPSELAELALPSAHARVAAAVASSE